MGECYRSVLGWGGDLEVRKELYIPDHELEVMDKISTVGRRGFSSYIVGLIKKDVHGTHIEYKGLTEEEVVSLILKYTRSSKVIVTGDDELLTSSIESVLGLLDF